MCLPNNSGNRTIWPHLFLAGTALNCGRCCLCLFGRDARALHRRRRQLCASCRCLGPEREGPGGARGGSATKRAFTLACELVACSRCRASSRRDYRMRFCCQRRVVRLGGGKGVVYSFHAKLYSLSTLIFASLNAGAEHVGLSPTRGGGAAICSGRASSGKYARVVAATFCWRDYDGIGVLQMVYCCTMCCFLDSPC